MPVPNSDVARIFNRMADLHEIESANAFRVRAYRNAARTIAAQEGVGHGGVLRPLRTSNP